jgi:outer membrane protein assembly factor BamB
MDPASSAVKALWLALCVGGLGQAVADDQPQWGARHSRNMASAETGLPTRFDPRTGQNLRWQIPLGTACYATPVVAGGRVFIGTNNGDPRDPRHRGDRGVLFCLDEKDGRLHWQLVVPKLTPDPYWDCPIVGITGSAVVEGERVYLVSNRGEVLCLDLQGQTNGNDGLYREEGQHQALRGDPPMEVGRLDADILWCFDMRAEVGAYTHDSANISPLLLGDHLCVTTPNGVDRTHRHRPSPEAPGLIVLDKLTGRLVAKDATGIGARVFHSSFSSPSAGTVNGQAAIFYGGGDGVVYAFAAITNAPTTGAVAILRELWRFDCDPAGPKQNISQYQGNRRESPSNILGFPVPYEDGLLVAAGGDPWHGKREAWLKCFATSGQGDITATALRWSLPLQRHSIATPAIRQGLVFITDFGRMLHAVDLATGRELWTHETEGEIWSSPLVADGKVYVAGKRGDFWVLAAQRTKQVLHRVDFPDELNGSPVAANGVLYVATMRKLYAFRQP